MGNRKKVLVSPPGGKAFQGNPSWGELFMIRVGLLLSVDNCCCTVEQVVTTGDWEHRGNILTLVKLG